MPERATTGRERRLVEERADRRCEYCLSPVDYSPDPFAVEHIVPRVRGRSHRPANLAFSCQGSNSYKRADTDALDSVSHQRVPLYHPRQDNWREHFAWNEDCTRLLGLTPTGRATIVKLELNRFGVVNLRRVLRSIGEHPPKDTLPQG
jgi:5-methylcytosine-specific restriction endonuclease McrA